MGWRSTPAATSPRPVTVGGLAPAVFSAELAAGRLGTSVAAAELMLAFAPQQIAHIERRYSAEFVTRYRQAQRTRVEPESVRLPEAEIEAALKAYQIKDDAPLCFDIISDSDLVSEVTIVEEAPRETLPRLADHPVVRVHDVAGTLLAMGEHDVVWLDPGDAANRAPMLKVAPLSVAGLLRTALACVLMATVDLGTVLLIMVMSLSGLMTGALMPSRDMIVRQVTPPGAYGKVFGFVTNGFNIAGMVSPLICGALMDRGEPRLVFLTLAVTALLAVFTVVSVPRRRARGAACELAVRAGRLR